MKSESMPSLLFAVDLSMMTLIWIVQLIVYPSFRYTAADQLQDWHMVYMGRIGIVVLPLMFAQAGLSLLLAVKATGAISIAHLVLVIAVWALTFVISSPLHSSLQAAAQPQEVIQRLVMTNWPRTILWSLLPLLSLILLIRPGDRG